MLAVLLLALQLPAPTPKDAAGWHALGVKYAQAADFELAEPAFAEACRLDPRHPDSCYSVGRVRYLLNRFAGAIAPFEQSIANREPLGRATLAIALAREALDEPAVAEPLFRKAMKLSTPDAELRYATFLLRQGRVEESVAMARKAVDRAPKSPYPLLELARAEHQQGDLASARKHVESALSLDPNLAQAHLLASRIYQRMGDAEKAARHLKAATPAQP